MVYEGKTALAKMAGYASLFKGVNLTFSTMDGKPLLSLKHTNFDTRNPFLGGMLWQTAIEAASGERVRYTLDKAYYGNKKIVTKLVEKTGSGIFKNDWTLAKNNDESDAILRDSSEIAQWQNKVAEQLSAATKGNSLYTRETPIRLESIRFRPKQTPIPLSYSQYEKTSELLIHKGRTVLGKVTKEQAVDQEGKRGRMRYIFYKKLEKPFNLKGQTSEYLIAAIAEFDAPDSQGAKLTTFQDQKTHLINGVNAIKINNLFNASQPLSDFLTLKGYL